MSILLPSTLLTSHFMRQLLSTPLRKEIVTVLVLKVILIFGIWYAFFSNPVDEHLTAQDIGTTLFGNPNSNTAVDKETADGR